MTDVYCRICGEPYEYYYLVEEEPEWKEPMLRGEGCPSCRGKRPSGEIDKEELALRHLCSIEETDLDTTEYI
jgi:methionyl-tRNA synthetase